MLYGAEVWDIYDDMAKMLLIDDGEAAVSVPADQATAVVLLE